MAGRRRVSVVGWIVIIGFAATAVAGFIVYTSASSPPRECRGSGVTSRSAPSPEDAIAEYGVTEGDSLVPDDGKLSPADAVVAQPLACVIYAVERMGNVAGQRVAVLGQGPIGMLFSHVLKSMGGAAHVILELRRRRGREARRRRELAGDRGRQLVPVIETFDGETSRRRIRDKERDEQGGDARPRSCEEQSFPHCVLPVARARAAS